MSIQVSCQCGKQFTARDEFAGHKARCSNCQTLLIIPRPDHTPQSRSPEPPVVPQPPGDDPLAMDSGTLADLPLPQPTQLPPPDFSVPPAARKPVPPRVAPGKKISPGLKVGLAVTAAALVLVAVVGLVLVLMSGERDPSGAAATTAIRGSANREGLNEPECLEVANQFAAAIQEGKPGFASRLIDLDELLLAATAGVDANKKERESFSQSYRRLALKSGVAHQLARHVEDGGTCRVIGTHRVGGETRAWVRLNGPQSINYVDLVFFRNDNGQPRIADVYVMGGGEFFSQTLRRLFAQAIAAGSPNAWQRLTGRESDWVRHAEKIRRMAARVHDRPADALAIYHQLPKSLRTDKSFLLLRIGAAASLGDQEYVDGVRDFRKHYPEDPSVDMISVHFHRVRKEFDLALSAIDRVDQAIGGDPFLNSLRVPILLEKGDAEGARRAADASFATSNSGPTRLQYGESTLQDRSVSPVMSTVEPGIEKAVVRLPVVPDQPGQTNRIYIYRPSGSLAADSLPCIFIAAAGGTHFTGREIGEADEPEFLPYAKAGFVVVGYGTDGEWKGETVNGLQAGFPEYRDSQAGLVNARNAMEYALANLPEIDENRLYTAGHSSAGRQAFLLAAHESRIRGCISFNGVLDLRESYFEQLELYQFLPDDARDFVMATSPHRYEEKIRCPVFLFHTEEDPAIPVEHSRECAARLEALGQQVTLEIRSGNHYQPMIEQGIPLAIEWLLGLEP